MLEVTAAEFEASTNRGNILSLLGEVNKLGGGEVGVRKVVSVLERTYCVEVTRKGLAFVKLRRGDKTQLRYDDLLNLEGKRKELEAERNLVNGEDQQFEVKVNDKELVSLLQAGFLTSNVGEKKKAKDGRVVERMHTLQMNKEMIGWLKRFRVSGGEEETEGEISEMGRELQRRVA